MSDLRQSVKCMMIAVILGLLPGISSRASAKPLKVFVLAGQSNMQGHANVSTFDSMADDPTTAPILKEMRNVDGTPRVCEQVWISSVGCAGDGWSDVIEQKGKLTAGFGASVEEIGPEFTFGIYMEKMLGEPILIIKTAWGGRSLSTDFRPPSAGPKVFNDFILSQWKNMGLDVAEEAAKNNKNDGVFYRHMIAHVHNVLGDIKQVVPEYDPKQGYELAGFVWFQGFNDLVDDWTYRDQMKPGGYDLYAELLADLVRDVRKDLAAPNLPFVIGVMGIGGVPEGKKPPQMHFRKAQASVASLPEFQGNVFTVHTEEFWDDRLAAIEEKKERVRQMEYLLSAKDKNSPNKDGTMTDAQQKEYLKKFEDELITTDEAALFKRGASNGGYHYLGSAKTFARIGQAFAKTLLTAREPEAEAKP